MIELRFNKPNLDGITVVEVWGEQHTGNDHDLRTDRCIIKDYVIGWPLLSDSIVGRWNTSTG
jgi:hypothetical protein